MRERVKNTRAKSLTRLGHREGKPRTQSCFCLRRKNKGKGTRRQQCVQTWEIQAEWGWGSPDDVRNASEWMKDISILYCQQVQVKTIKRINIFLYRGCMLKFSERLKRKKYYSNPSFYLYIRAWAHRVKGDRTCWLAGRKFVDACFCKPKK